MNRRLLTGLAMAAALISGSVPPASAQSEFQYQERPLPPLLNSHVFTLVGEPVAEGCAYAYPELELPPGETGIEQRDIGVNHKDCIKLVEVGTPIGDIDTIEEAGGTGDLNGSDDTRWYKRAYLIVWFEDAAGLMLTSDETHIRFSYDHTCAYRGFGYAAFFGFKASGWEPVPGSMAFTEDRTCTRYKVTSQSEMKNSNVCSPVTVYTKYYYVELRCFYNGTLNSYQSADAVNECLPLWKHSRLRLVSSGRDGR